MQCVAECCSVLQCAEVCCSVLQSVAVCCSVLKCVLRIIFINMGECACVSLLRSWPNVLQCVAMRCSVLKCVAICCRVLQCVAVCCRYCSWPWENMLVFPSFVRDSIWCSVLQCVAVCCSVLQCVAVFCSVLQCASMLQFNAILKNVASRTSESCHTYEWVMSHIQMSRGTHTNESYCTHESCHTHVKHASSAGHF